MMFQVLQNTPNTDETDTCLHLAAPRNRNKLAKSQANQTFVVVATKHGMRWILKVSWASKSSQSKHWRLETKRTSSSWTWCLEGMVIRMNQTTVLKALFPTAITRSASLFRGVVWRSSRNWRVARIASIIMETAFLFQSVRVDLTSSIHHDLHVLAVSVLLSTHLLTFDSEEKHRLPWLDGSIQSTNVLCLYYLRFDNINNIETGIV
jgi:hypothetical protein